MTKKQHVASIFLFSLFCLILIGCAGWALFIKKPNFADICSAKSHCGPGLRCVNVSQQGAWIGQRCAWPKHSRAKNQSCLLSQDSDTDDAEECVKGLECVQVNEDRPKDLKQGVCGEPQPKS